MGKIDDGREILAQVDPLHPPGDTGQAGQTFGRHLRVDPQPHDGRCQRSETIRNVKSPDERGMDFNAEIRAHRRVTDAARGVTDVFGADRGFRGEAIAGNRHLGHLRQIRVGLVIAIEDCQPRIPRSLGQSLRQTGE